MEEIREKIRNVPDFPKPGIQFKDITTLLKDGEAFARVIDRIDEQYRDQQVDVVVGIESRGFIFGGALAYKWKKGFVPVRKPGKLPADSIKEEYELEYGTDSLEIHKDAIRPGQKVLIVDDLLATGGTARAVTKLVERLGGIVVGVAFLIELGFLGGRKQLENYDIFTIVNYDAEE